MYYYYKMNKKQTPQDLLQEIYKYVCLTVQHDKTAYYPKNIWYIENCFKQLLTHIEDKEFKNDKIKQLKKEETDAYEFAGKPKVDGYNSRK